MRQILVVVALAACSGTGAQPDAGPTRSEVALIPTTVNRDVDVLFAIEDSPGTLDAQTDLRAAFPSFINVLDTVAGGLPNLHLGVVTSDLGTKGADDAQPGPTIGSGPGSCAGNGKAGNLTTSGATSVTGTFISDIKNTDGTRTTNYSGSLDGALSMIAAVGAAGCGFEQHAEAI